MDEKELLRIIGRNIHRLRKASGMTQEQLAEKVNRSTGTISHIETGTSTLGIELLFTMANLFSVSVNDIVYPENSTSSFKRITSILSKHSDESLSDLEAYIQIWDSKHNKPTPPTDNK